MVHVSIVVFLCFSIKTFSPSDKGHVLAFIIVMRHYLALKC